MKVQPCGARVLVKPDESPEVTPGGIRVVDPDPPSSGVIVEAGPQSRFCHSQPELLPGVGTRVHFSKFSGVTIKVDGDALTLLDETEVLAYEF